MEEVYEFRGQGGGGEGAHRRFKRFVQYYVCWSCRTASQSRTGKQTATLIFDAMQRERAGKPWTELRQY